ALIGHTFDQMRKDHAGDKQALALIDTEEAGFHKLVATHDSGKAEDAEISKIMAPIRVAESKLGAIDEERAKSKRAQADDTSKSKRMLMLVALLAGLAGGVAAVFALIRNIVPRINSASRFAAKVADGDLTERIEPRGGDAITDLANTLNTMVENLADTSTRMKTNPATVPSSANEVLASVTEQNAGANQQSAAINQPPTATEQIRASAELAAQKASDVSEQAQDAVRVSEEGSQAVG